MKITSTKSLAKQFQKKYGPKKKGRYTVSDKASRTSEDGIIFDSKWEMEAYNIIKSVVPEENFKLQQSYELQPGFLSEEGKKVQNITYVSDFLITSSDRSKTFVVDTKGHLTDIFRLKEKMFMYKTGKVIHKLHNKTELSNLLQSAGYTWIYIRRGRKS